MVDEACLPSNASYPLTPDYNLYSWVHVCWSEHSDLSFVYGFMSLDYGLWVCGGRDGTVLALVLSVSLFWMAMSPGVPRVGCACLNLLDSPGLIRILVALAAVMGPLLPDFLDGAVVVLGFVGRFRGFVSDAVSC